MPNYQVTYWQEQETIVEVVEVLSATDEADAEQQAQDRLQTGQVAFESQGKPIGFPWVERIEEQA
jgi:hypothetical protein